MRTNSPWIQKMLQILYPEHIYCMACGKPILPENRDSLCTCCRESLQRKTAYFCSKCGRIAKKRPKSDLCPDCRADLPVFSRGMTCCVYEGAAKKIIYDLKYAAKGYLAKNMAYIMEKRAPRPCCYDIIVPVPMFGPKKLRRGYNQAELLAKELASLTGKPCVPQCLRRIRDTAPMSGLSRGERKENIKNMLQAERPKIIRGKNILLVDDVFTTGSTVNECCRILLAAGAGEIFVLTFAAAEAKGTDGTLF